MDCEEPTLPVKFSERSIRLWSKCRQNSVIKGKVEDEGKSIEVEPSRHFRHQEHARSINFEMKKYLRWRPRASDLMPKLNEGLPQYLQDIELHNPELMNHTPTRVRCTLPSSDVIEEERAIEAAGRKKMWREGLVLRSGSSLLEPGWGKMAEVKYINAVREDMARSPSVVAGILQQWQR